MAVSKIITSILGGLIVTVGSAYAFTEGDTLKKASQFVQDAQNKIVQYENNENQLVQLLDTIKMNANSKIGQANDIIANLEQHVMTLQSELTVLENEILQLETQLLNEKVNHEETLRNLETLQSQYDTKVALLVQKEEELMIANDRLAKADESMILLESEFEKANGEILEANDACRKHGDVVAEAEAQTKNANPIPNEELQHYSTDLQKVKYTATLQPQETAK